MEGIKQIVDEMQRLALENKKIMSVSRNWWTGEVNMPVIRCCSCERNIDVDSVEMDFVNGKDYCQDCEIPFKELLLDWIDKNSFTDFGNRDSDDSPDLECVYVDELIKFIKGEGE
jgi:hypothetical protein